LTHCPLRTQDLSTYPGWPSALPGRRAQCTAGTAQQSSASLC